MKISYWDCVYSDYDEQFNEEEGEATRFYGCHHPDKRGYCDSENWYSEEECEYALGWK